VAARFDRLTARFDSLCRYHCLERSSGFGNERDTRRKDRRRGGIAVREERQGDHVGIVGGVGGGEQAFGRSSSRRPGAGEFFTCRAGGGQNSAAVYRDIAFAFALYVRPFGHRPADRHRRNTRGHHRRGRHALHGGPCRTPPSGRTSRRARPDQRELPLTQPRPFRDDGFCWRAALPGG
jgi:hypothetical protein